MTIAAMASQTQSDCLDRHQAKQLRNGKISKILLMKDLQTKEEISNANEGFFTQMCPVHLITNSFAMSPGR